MTVSASPQKTPGNSKPKTLLLVPFAIAAVMLLFLLFRLRSGEELSELQSTLIGKAVPEFALAPVPNLLGDSGPVPGLSSAALKTGKPAILNVWASWCVPCTTEMPQLAEAARRGIAVYGINYKDKPEAARRFLANYGNPFRAIGADANGMTAIDFGVYGVPESFVVDGDGKVLFRLPGELTEKVLEQKIIPILKKAGWTPGRS